MTQCDEALFPIAKGWILFAIELAPKYFLGSSIWLLRCVVCQLQLFGHAGKRDAPETRGGGG